MIVAVLVAGAVFAGGSIGGGDEGEPTATPPPRAATATPTPEQPTDTTVPPPTPTFTPTPTPTASPVTGQEPPFRDMFPGGEIAGLTFSDVTDTVGMSVEPREPLTCEFEEVSLGSTVWYRFTPQQDMELYSDTFGSDFDTVLAVYVGPDLGSLEQTACNDDVGDASHSGLTFMAFAGETYYFQAGGYEKETGSLDFFLEPVSSDTFPGLLISDLSFQHSVDTVAATLESDEPRTCQGNEFIGATVWYRFTPQQDMELYADTFGSDFDTILAVYESAGQDLPRLIRCNDDSLDTTQSVLTFMASAGVTYYFQVGGFQGETGFLNFYVEEVELSSNDIFPGMLIRELWFEDRVDTFGGTVQESEPLICQGESIGATKWYEYTPGQDTVLRADTFGSDFDTVLAVYASGQDTDDPLACNDDAPDSSQSKVTFLAYAGETYYFQVGGFQGETGFLVFYVEEGELLSNDLFPGTSIQQLFFEDSMNTFDATVEPDEPLLCELDEASIGSTVWYSYTPQEDMVLYADTLNSDFDTVLAVYVGSDVGQLQPIACNDDGTEVIHSEVTFEAFAGETYYFQAGGFEGQSGFLTFYLERRP